MNKVLLVDDSVFMRKVLKEMVNGEKYQVVGEASSGLEAIEKFKTLEPQIVLMDYNMPGMDGLETTRSILDYTPSAIIIMITSISTTDKVVEAIECGVKDYLTKPFTKSEILSKLEEAIEEVDSF